MNARVFISAFIRKVRVFIRKVRAFIRKMRAFIRKLRAFIRKFARSLRVHKKNFVINFDYADDGGNGDGGDDD